MRQEHPFFSSMQMFFGKPLRDEEEILLDSWSISLGELEIKPKEATGLFILWTDKTPSQDEIHFT